MSKCDFQHEHEKNIDEFYKDFEDCMKKIALDTNDHNPYRIIDAIISKNQRVQYFRTIFFRMLFIKILHSWNIIQYDPIEEYVLNTNEESEYYTKLCKVFFGVLNTPLEKRTTDVKIPILNSIPYLNGGLFRKRDIELQNQDIAITGKGIVYIWEKISKFKYIPKSFSEDDDKNFISPKALGHIFEKTMNISGGDRKGTGSYYTPKNITSYISSNSIEQYILNRVNAYIEQHKKQSQEHSTQAIIKYPIKNLNFHLDLNFSDEACDFVVSEILRILANIKICDNSCGSGAFLDSVAEKLEKLYLDMYAIKGRQELPMFNKEARNQNNPSEGIFNDIYSLRKHIIINNLYGVDIQEEAIEIAKLRLWLWLINPYDEKTQKIIHVDVEPLPNIDYNIMVGNSLIGFEKLGSIHYTIKSSGIYAYTGKYNVIQKIIELKQKYKNSSNQHEIYELQSQIKALIDPFYHTLNELYCEHVLKDIYIPISIRNVNEIKRFSCGVVKGKITFKKNTVTNAMIEPIIYNQKGIKKNTNGEYIHSILFSSEKTDNIIKILDKIKNEYIESIEAQRKICEDDLIKMKVFHWAVEFFDIFERGGFDIIVGNPPYIRHETLKHIFEEQNYKEVLNIIYNNSILNKKFTILKTVDICIYFFIRGYQLLAHKQGILSYIITNKWMQGNYGEYVRYLLSNYTYIQTLIDLPGVNVFKGIGVDTIIIQFQKIEKKNNNIFFNNPKDIYSLNKEYYFIDQQELTHECWSFLSKKEFEIKKWMEKNNTKIMNTNIKIYRGISTGYKEAFIISNEQKIQLEKDPQNLQFIHPLIEGRDLRPYSVNWRKKWVIVIPSGFTNQNIKGKNIAPEKFIEKEYPKIYSHFLQFTEKQEVKNEIIERTNIGDYWWELRKCAYYDNFSIPKIIYSEISSKSSFRWDTHMFYTGDTTYITKNADKSCVLLLNSKTIRYYMKTIASFLGNNALMYIKIFIEKIPIVYFDDNDKNMICNIIDMIQFGKDISFDVTNMIFISEYLVYELYFHLKFYEDGIYEHDERYLLQEVKKHIVPIEYESWSTLYWKELIGKINKKEKEQLELLTQKNKELVDICIKNIEQDKKIKDIIQKIQSHEWIKIIEKIEQ